MHNVPDIDEDLLHQLKERAEQKGCTVAELLTHFLENDFAATPSPYAYLDVAPSAISIVDVSQPHQPTIYVNKAFEQVSGYSADEILGQNLNFLQGDDRNQPGRAVMRRTIQQQTTCTAILRNYHKDGTMFWNEIHLAPLPDEQGRMTRYISIQNDVTQRIEAQKALANQENTLKLALQAAHAGVWVWDIASGQIAGDEAMDAIYGLEPGTFDGDYDAWRALIHPDDLASVEAGIQAALHHNQTLHEIFRIIRPDGSPRHILARAVVVWDELTDSPRLMIGVVIDVTERKHVEDVLRESTAQMRWLIENMPVMVDAFDESYQLVMWNQECERVTGYTAAELVGNPQAMELLYPDPDYRQYVFDNAENFGHDYRNQTYTLTTKDGTQKIINWSNVSPRYPIPGWNIWAIGIDVTEQRHAEQLLRQSEEKYRLLIENSQQGIVITQANPLRISFASKPIQKITGYTPEELTQFTLEQLSTLTHPDDRERHSSNIRALLLGEDIETNSRYRLIHRSGEVRYVDTHSVRIEYDGEVALQTVLLDVTERVEVERLKTRFQSEQERNVLVQRIVSMLSHDLRTPLAVISSSRDILARYFDRLSDEARQEKLDIIGRQVQFAIEMLEDAVSIVRGPLNIREFNPQSVNLAMLCKISIDEIQIAQHKKQQMRFVNKGIVDNVSIDEVLVSRILLNLLSNAVKYSPNGGEIRLELDRCDEWVLLRVIDHGMGIDEGDLPHIFDPFFRADDVTHINGTGLGLSIVKDCVDRHQGRIHVESVPGQGSIFTVKLPVQVENLE